MRKILIGIVVFLMLIGSAYLIVNGTDKVNIQSYKDLRQKDNELQEEISKLSNIISVTYEKAQEDLKITANTLTQSRTEYENQAILSENNSKSGYVSKSETYNIDYLWTKLGNYAKEEGVVIKIEVTANGVAKDLYDLKFMAAGTYVGTTNFIYDIENDSKLGFKIDNFSMSASADYTINANFTCKDIPIEKIDKEIKATTENKINEDVDGNKIIDTEGNKNTSTASNTINTSENSTANTSTDNKKTNESIKN